MIARRSSGGVGDRWSVSWGINGVVSGWVVSVGWI
jgi:hypothetical protein